MKLSTKIAYNTLVQLIGKVLSTALGLAAMAMIMRYLGTFGFGEYTTIITFLSFFAIAADFGLTLVTVQMISREGADENYLLGNLYAFRLFSAVAMLSLGPIAIFFFPYSASIKAGAILAAFTFLFPALNQILIGLFQRKLRMDKVALAELAGRAVLIAGVFLVIFYGFGLNGIIIASAVAAFFNYALLHRFSLRFAKIKLIWDYRVWLSIFQKSWPITITIAFNLLYLKTDTLILSLVKNTDSVGLYGAAYRIIDVLSTVPFMFAGIIMPVLTHNHSIGKRDEFKNILQRSLDIIFMLALPLVVGTQFVAGNIIELVAGPEFAPAAGALRILVIACAMLFIGCLPSHAIVAIDKQKKVIPAYIFTAATSIIGYLIFIPAYSYTGAAWVTVYSEGMIAVLMFSAIKKYTDFRLNLKVFSKTLAASLIMGAGLIIMQGKPLAFSLLLGCIIYFMFLYLLGGIKKEELLEIIKWR